MAGSCVVAGSCVMVATLVVAGRPVVPDWGSVVSRTLPRVMGAGVVGGTTGKMSCVGKGCCVEEGGVEPVA